MLEEDAKRFETWPGRNYATSICRLIKAEKSNYGMRVTLAEKRAESVMLCNSLAGGYASGIPVSTIGESDSYLVCTVTRCLQIILSLDRLAAFQLYDAWNFFIVFSFDSSKTFFFSLSRGFTIHKISIVLILSDLNEFKVLTHAQYKIWSRKFKGMFVLFDQFGYFYVGAR